MADDQIPMIGRGDEGGVVDRRSIQDHRNEAYQGGWDDGYAEGSGKADADLRVEVERLRNALRAASEDFESIRLLLINNLFVPEASAFWRAIHGRQMANAALSTLSDGSTYTQEEPDNG